MDVTTTAFGSWNGGRFMHYGEPLGDDSWIGAALHAHSQGIQTFLTADVYGSGQADSLMGRALAGLPRDTYSLVGMIGHDFYAARRDGAKGFPRFTHPDLRGPSGYADYLRMAAEKSLQRLGQDRFDLLMLHNPDHIGYTHDAVWNGLHRLVDAGLARSLGVAPGPANGFTLDLILCFERFGALIDWTMIILNPFEPWPGSLVLPAAERHGVNVLTRVVDYGGIFHDDVRPGHRFGESDHRCFRPGGWVEAGNAKLDRLRPIAIRHGLTPLQMACAWNLNQPAVRCVAPTLIQEIGADCKPIETKIGELAAIPDVRFSEDELRLIRDVGDNTGCMALKGGSQSHSGPDLADQWSLGPELEAVAGQWGIVPDRDLAFTHGSR